MKLREIKKRYYLLIILIVISIGFYKYLYTSCPKMNPDYFSWFPYIENDILIFETANKEQLQLKVDYFEVNHTDRYSRFTKCGHCEDYVHMILNNQNDTLDITMNNLDNENSYFGYSFDCYYNSEEFYGYHKDTIINNKKTEIISNNKCLIVKDKGIISFKVNDKIYKLSKVIRIDKERKNIKGGC